MSGTSNSHETVNTIERPENFLEETNNVGNLDTRRNHEDILGTSEFISGDEKLYDDKYDEDAYYSMDESTDSEVDDSDDTFYDCSATFDDVASQENNEVEELKRWAVLCAIKHSHLTKLLAILRRRVLPELPKTAVTLLGTKNPFEIIEFSDQNGNYEFVYFSIKRGLEMMMNTKIYRSSRIKAQMSIDGLPLYKGSLYEFYVISCKVVYDPDIFRAFPVAIHYGQGKPQDTEIFFADFVNELTELMADGLTIDGRHFDFSVHCYICDTPARAFSKFIKGHTGFYCCERCDVKGERVNYTTVFPTEGNSRSDSSFRSRVQPEHHVGTSPLENVRPKINMVKDFVLDFMHLCCIGIMKSLLTFWLDPDRGTRLGIKNRRCLSNRMENLRNQVPREFQRRPRSTKTWKHWKATEFRFFLIYGGPLVMKGLLSKIFYMHFLLFHVGCRILCMQKLATKLNDVAKLLFHRFFHLTKKLYGKKSQTINFHNLMHLCDDVLNKSCTLMKMTAFPFENLLGLIKRMLRSGNKPLAQVCRRLHEQYFVQNQKVALPRLISNVKMHKQKSDEILRMTYKSYYLSKF